MWECKENEHIENGKCVKDLECDKWYQNLKVKETCGANPLCWAGIVKPKTIEKCGTATWLILTILAIILAIILTVFILVKRFIKR